MRVGLTAKVTRISLRESCKPLLAKAPTLCPHQSTCWQQRPCRTPFSTAALPLSNLTGDLLQPTLHRRRSCRIHPGKASPQTRDKSATLPIFLSPTFPPLASETQQLATTHDPFTASLTISRFINGDCAKTTSYYMLSSPESSAA